MPSQKCTIQSPDDLLQYMQIIESGACPYLDGRDESIRLLRCPSMPDNLGYQLLERGFRHSGDIFYRPECRHCRQCVSLRIHAQSFKPGKKQRHILHANSDITMACDRPKPTSQKFELYLRYLSFKHPEKAHETTYDDFISFLYTPLNSSYEMIYDIHHQIAGITIADIYPNQGMSSVYHYFDPAFAKRSIGVFSILTEIGFCRQFDIPYYYLGYWIKDCQKMNYKNQYRPNEILIDGHWKEHE